MTTDWAGIAALMTVVTGLVVAILKFVLDFYKLRKELELMAVNVQKIETATNSMKDALVKAAFLAGGDQEREKERDKQEEIKIAVKEATGSEDDPLHVKLTDDKKKA